MPWPRLLYWRKINKLQAKIWAWQSCPHPRAQGGWRHLGLCRALFGEGWRTHVGMNRCHSLADRMGGCWMNNPLHGRLGRYRRCQEPSDGYREALAQGAAGKFGTGVGAKGQRSEQFWSMVCTCACLHDPPRSVSLHTKQHWKIPWCSYGKHSVINSFWYEAFLRPDLCVEHILPFHSSSTVLY